MVSNYDSKSLLIGNDTFTSLVASESAVFSELKHLDLNVHRDVENWKRSIVIDWIMDVCSEYLLTRKTFHLAVTLYDRYLLKEPAIRERDLQLLAAACL